MKYQLRTFADLVNAICEELKIQKSDLESVRRIKRNINTVYMTHVVPFKERWHWLNSNVSLQTEPYFNLGTADVEQNSVTVTLTQSPATSRKGYYFSAGSQDEIYKILSHAPGSNTLTLETPYNGATNALTGYYIWTDAVPLPAECKEVLEVMASGLGRPLEGMGLQQLRRLQAGTGPWQGVPGYYTVSPYQDPAPFVSIAGLPLAVSRASNGLIKTLSFQADVSSMITAGDRIQISSAGEASYNGIFTVSSVSGTDITFTGTAQAQEATINDASFVVEEAASPNSSGYKNLIIYPAAYNRRMNLFVDYQIEPEELEFDGDEPLIPVEDRSVLFHGGMWLSASRERNPEWAQEQYALMMQKLQRMSGKGGDTLDRPVMRISRNYVGSKRRGGATRLSYGDFWNDGVVGPLGAGVGAAPAPTGTPNTVAVFNELGYLVGSDTVIPGSFDANALGYDNTGTTIAATTVQNAITELDQDNVAQSTAITSAQSAIAGVQAVNTSQDALIAANTANIALKANLASPALTGIPTAPTAAPGDDSLQIATTEFVQDALNGAVSPTGTPNTAAIYDGTGALVSSSTTSAEIGYLSGVTSSVQTQLNGKQPTGSYITALSGDVVAAGPGSAASTIQPAAVTNAKIAAGIDALKIAAGSVDNTEFGYLDGVTSAIQTQLNAKAPLASPALTGTPTVPTAAPGTNSTQAASTAFVTAAVAAVPAAPVTSVFSRTGAVVSTTGDYTATQITNTPAGGIAATNVQAAITELDTEKANLASPTFTGIPAAPTASNVTNSTQIATTAFVQNNLSLKANLASPTFTGVPAAPTAAAATNTTQLATTAFVTTAVAAVGGTLYAPTRQQLTGSGTYTLPVSPKVPVYILVELLGAGGGGGGSSNTGAAQSSAGSGGGGGGYVRRVIASPASTYSYSVGGTTTGGSPASTGSTGASSTFDTLTAAGGIGGPGSGASGTLGTGNGAAAGGSASGGDLNIAGQYGQSGLIFGASGVGFGGPGANSIYGAGGGQSVNAAGVAAAGFGAGGGGASTGASASGSGGGAGSAGTIIITEYYQ